MASRQEATLAEAGLAEAWASFQAISFPEPLSNSRDLCSQGELTGTWGHTSLV